ncbi:MAG: hypothetical protein ACP5VC_18325, partial [Bryobacteraceae bacterium]
MSIITIEFPPLQPKFDQEALRGFDVKRRQLRTSWPNVVHPPATTGKDLRVRLPFEQTYLGAFESMVDWPIRSFTSEQGAVTIYLQGTEGEQDAPECVQQWVHTVGQYVAMRDYLAHSFALDYEREGGDLGKPQTTIGVLRAQAKPYGGQGVTTQTKAAADQLVDRCLEFLNEMTCYKSANCVVAMPPSDPTKTYNLPQYLAAQIAAKRGLEDLSTHVQTMMARGSITNCFRNKWTFQPFCAARKHARRDARALDHKTLEAMRIR